MSECENILKMIDDYIDNDLSEQERKKIEEHIKECQSCRDEIRFATAVKKATEEIELPSAPTDFLDRVHAAIDNEKVIALPNKKIKPIIFAKRWQTGIAACLIVAAFLGINMGELSDGLFSGEHNDEIVNIINEDTEEIPQTTAVPTAENSQTPKSENKEKEVKQEKVLKKTEEKTEKKASVSEEKREEVSPMPTKPPVTVHEKTENKSIQQTETPTKETEVMPKESSEETVEVQSVSEKTQNEPTEVMQDEPVALMQIDETQLVESDNTAVTARGSGAENMSRSLAKGVSDGILKVQSDRLNEAKNIAMHYGSCENGVFGMTAEKYKEYLAELEKENIEYIDSTVADDAVRFEIID